MFRGERAWEQQTELKKIQQERRKPEKRERGVDIEGEYARILDGLDEESEDLQIRDQIMGGTDEEEDL